MNKKRTLYNFGFICGLVGKNAAAVQEHPESALCKRAENHTKHLCSDWRKVIAGELTLGQKHALRFGKAQGLKARREMA